MADAFWLGLACFFVLEGLLPFIAPARWRQWLLQMAQLRDGQIRFFGLMGLVVGAVLLLLV